MHHISDDAETFELFLADTRANGVPSLAVIVRSDGRGIFPGGALGNPCRSR